MRFDPATCPECGEPARGTLDDITGCAQFSDPDTKGNVEYAGDTEVFWDGQMTRKGNTEGTVMLLDRAGHEWEARELPDAKGGRPPMLTWAVRFEVPLTIHATTREVANVHKDRLAAAVQRAVRRMKGGFADVVVEAGPAEQL
jgi:hypothetical protein